jgi:hypothetical protein
MYSLIKAFGSWQKACPELKHMELMDGFWMSGAELGRI